MSNRSLQNKVVVVTGGTAGVGRAAVTAFARAGAKVAALSRDPQRVQSVTAALRGQGRGFVVDVSDFEALERTAAEIERTLGPIDVWVNNAMTTVFGRFADMRPEEFAKVTQNTYLGTVYGTGAALRRMLPRNHGVIVQVGSALAFQSIPLQSAYCGAKHGIRGFTNALRCELKADHSRVRVAMVHLSAFNTPQFEWARSYLPKHPRPLAPIFEPSLAAEAIVRAAARPRREYWVGWPAVKAIWASRLVPALAERRAAAIAIDGQMLDDEPCNPRAGNLFEPVPRAATPEGRFSKDTLVRSAQWRFSKYRRPLLAGALAAAASLIIAALFLK